ncbi:amino acid adenylation domain-containing protein [Brevibacillus panacihumi]|uniref:amino acid adenylation domain-containing protein n=1 Tax=Brevibacillus panacihumi TaxID=497735 RepID=UPI003D204B5F
MSTYTKCLAFSNMVELLRYRAEKHPDRIAYRFLEHGEKETIAISYAELDVRAKQIALSLQPHISDGDRVLLLFPQGIDFVCAFMGCLYAHVTAVPVYPPKPRSMDRLQGIVEDSRPAVALTTSDVRGSMNATRLVDKLREVPLLDIDMIDCDPNDWVKPEKMTADSLAFLQYTSGSTSSPKGVMVTHANLLANHEMIKQAYGHDEQSIFVSWLPLFHDMGLIGNALQTLYLGSTCILMDPADFIHKPVRWLKAISTYRAHTSGGPNFAYELCARAITDEQCKGLNLNHWQAAFNGAEPVRQETMDQFVQRFGPYGFRQDAFQPCYGMAETTLLVTGGKKPSLLQKIIVDPEELKNHRVCPLPPAEQSKGKTVVGCGSPWLDQEVRIVHPDTREALGQMHVGEIWIQGPHVAKGYWNKAEASLETFGARLADWSSGPYLRTGDMGFMINNELFVTGRCKDLMIIRGRNYYPQDLEYTAERSHEAIRHDCSAAFVIEEEASQQIVLVHEIERTYRSKNLDQVVDAIYQAISEEHELQVNAIILIRPGSIPKTTSGKIQRSKTREAYLRGALPTLKEWCRLGKEEANGEQSAPALDNLQNLEQWLSGRVATILGVSPDRIESDQPLTRMGFDSIHLIQFLHAIESGLQSSVTLKRLLEGPTLRELAAELSVYLPEAIENQQREEIQTEKLTSIPMTDMQRSLWFMQKLAPASTAYHVTKALRLPMVVDEMALQNAFGQLVERHAILRSSIAEAGEEPRLLIHPSIPWGIHWEDADVLSDKMLYPRLKQLAEQPFDLENGPLFEVYGFRRRDDLVLLLRFHHIIVDFWSLGILLQELGTIYTALSEGRQAALPEPTSTFADYAAWHRQWMATTEKERQLTYWEEQLSGELPVLDLPTDKPRPAIQTYRGTIHQRSADAKLLQKLNRIARQNQTTLYTLLLSAYQILLHRYTGQDDILVGSPSAGRTRARDAKLVGYLVNPLVMRGCLSGQPSFEQFLARMRQVVGEALANQLCPFSEVVKRVGQDRDPSRSPIFQTMFVMQQAPMEGIAGLTAFALDEPDAGINLGTLEMKSYTDPERMVQYDITLTAGVSPGRLALSWEYNTDLFAVETIERMSRHFVNLLESIASNPSQSIGYLSMLDPSEEQMLLHGWNMTDCPKLQEIDLEKTCLPEMFARQATKTPDAIAVSDPKHQISYRELDQWARRIAITLHRQSCKAENIVAIYIDRSCELIAAILGVLQAGGAYLPIDPAYPLDRVRRILDDSQATFILTTKKHAAFFEEKDGRIILLDQIAPDDLEISGLENEVAGLPEIRSSEEVASLIYTSGSTGQPKGVMLTHKGIVNVIASFLLSYDPSTQDRMLPLTSVASASFIGEMFPILCAGGELVLPDTYDVLDPDRLIRIIEDKQITMLSTVPAVIARLNQMAARLPKLRLLLSGGEALSWQDVDQLIGRVTLVNGYGLTETTVCSTYEELDARFLKEKGRISIGKPVINTQVYLLDEHLRPVPVGVTGEMYIAGYGVARGYWNNERQTNQSFLPNPFRPNSKMYKTGDLARWLPDGLLEYKGRADKQIKLRGYRIEPGEIEFHLNRHASVNKAVVVLQPVLNEKRLVAYFTLKEGSKAPSLHEWRQWLKTVLPDYMIPAAFLEIPKLPYLVNGKLDVLALPLPETTSSEMIPPTAAPKSEWERIISEIWQEVLQVPHVGRDDNFFDLGGHSLNIVTVQKRLIEWRKQEIPLVDMFKYPTIRSLAVYLSARDQGEQTKQIDAKHIHSFADARKAALHKRKQMHMRIGGGTND